MNDRPREIAEMLARRAQAGHRLELSSIVLFELEYGIGKSRRQAENEARLTALLGGHIEVLPFLDDDARTAVRLRPILAAKGTPIGPYEVLIGGHALKHGATLITSNVKEFSRIEGLAVEDWLAA